MTTVRELWDQAGRPRSWYHFYWTNDERLTEWLEATPPLDGRCQAVLRNCWDTISRGKGGIWCGAALPCGFHEPTGVERRKAISAVRTARRRDLAESRRTEGPLIAGVPAATLLYLKRHPGAEAALAAVAHILEGTA